MIEEEENFDRDWLQERYPFDVEARDKICSKSKMVFSRTK